MSGLSTIRANERYAFIRPPVFAASTLATSWIDLTCRSFIVAKAHRIRSAGFRQDLSARTFGLLGKSPTGPRFPKL